MSTAPRPTYVAGKKLVRDRLQSAARVCLPGRAGVGVGAPGVSRERELSTRLSYRLGRETLPAEGASEGVDTANHVPWRWQRPSRWGLRRQGTWRRSGRSWQRARREYQRGRLRRRDRLSGRRRGPHLDRRCGRRRGRQVRRLAPRPSQSQNAPRHALLREHPEVGCLSGASPRSMGVRARRSRWPRVPMTCGLACRASFLFHFVLQLPSIECRPVNSCWTSHRSQGIGISPGRTLDTRNSPNGLRSVHLGDTPW
jgi:hypothetical protein